MGGGGGTAKKREEGSVPKNSGKRKGTINAAASLKCDVRCEIFIRAVVL